MKLLNIMISHDFLNIISNIKKNTFKNKKDIFPSSIFCTEKYQKKIYINLKNKQFWFESYFHIIHCAASYSLHSFVQVMSSFRFGEKQKMAASDIKYTYFNLQGKGETIRLVLAAAGVSR